MSFADVDAILARAMRAWRPPPRLTLSEWADRFFVLSPENAAEPGRWKTLPYQRGLLDAITDPAVTQVSVMKSARVGFTLCMSAGIGYFMHQDPSSMLVVRPTVDDAKEYSKETIAPMLRDVPVLAQMVFRDLEEKGPKDGSATLLHKAFPGGILSLIGANSGAGFRGKSRRVVMFDEVDAYPPSAGSDGDQIKLGTKRAEAFWNRKIIAGSTPLLAGASRIAEMFEDGDQRRYHVPCPRCGCRDFLTFREQTGAGARGHWMAFDASSPERAMETAHFVCRGCRREIDHSQKRWMVQRGEWIADRPFRGHASFHVWTAYSYSPNASWGHIAAEFVEANRGGPEKLRTFVNTTLGETWVEKGEAPEWQRLYERRERYPRGVVPAGIVLVTAGVDVQRDRLVYEIVGWGGDLQSWSIDAGVLMGDTSEEQVWGELDALLGRTWPSADGIEHRIDGLGVDSGYNTQMVYNWARRHPMSRVFATKGVSGAARPLYGLPTAVEVKSDGKRRARGHRIWTIGVDTAKQELYGWLQLRPPTKEGEPYPPGYCHFPEYDEGFFKQLTAEHQVRVVKRTGSVRFEWHVASGRENHALDARVIARAVAAIKQLDRFAAARRARAATPAPPATPAVSSPMVEGEERPTHQGRRVPSPSEAAASDRPSRSGWLGGRSGGTVGGGGWIRRRR